MCDVHALLRALSGGKGARFSLSSCWLGRCGAPALESGSSSQTCPCCQSSAVTPSLQMKIQRQVGRCNALLLQLLLGSKDPRPFAALPWCRGARCDLCTVRNALAGRATSASFGHSSDASAKHVRTRTWCCARCLQLIFGGGPKSSSCPAGERPGGGLRAQQQVPAAAHL